jgi:hypothetical protein
MSKADVPPVPPASKSDKGPGGARKAAPQADADAVHSAKERDVAHQGRQGNIKQNTTNKGFQQDR